MYFLKQIIDLENRTTLLRKCETSNILAQQIMPQTDRASHWLIIIYQRYHVKDISPIFLLNSLAIPACYLRARRLCQRIPCVLNVAIVLGSFPPRCFYLPLLLALCWEGERERVVGVQAVLVKSNIVVEYYDFYLFCVCDLARELREVLVV